MTENEHPEWRQGMRFLPIFLFVVAIALLFVGGIAALIYWAFTEYTNFRSIWVLVCCLPVLVIVGVFGVVYSLYSRYGRPLGQMFDAIDSVAEGDLSVRVPADSSPQFGELIKRFNKMVEELQRSDKQRRDLTADIAHELRTPLHIIQGKLEGIQDGVYQPTPQHIGDALDDTKLLGRLVEDLQTLSLAESGQLPLHKTRFAVGDLLKDVVNGFAERATQAGIMLRQSAAADMEINADYLRLSQVLSNLVSNALRYTPEHGVISLETERIADKIRIRVSDTGSGIAAEDLPLIFDRFWRSEKARTREGHHNSGLGLAISRQLILAHNGTIEVHSAIGRGTEFVIRLAID